MSLKFKIYLHLVTFGMIKGIESVFKILGFRTNGLSLNGVFSIHECVNTVDHVLDKFFLGLTESSSVGDIEDTVISFGMLSVDSSDLDLVFVSNFVHLLLNLHEFWEVDVDGSSHGGTKVGWA